MLPQSMTLILILLVVVNGCWSAELPGNAYLPPPPPPPPKQSSLLFAADESLLSVLNGFLIFDSAQDSQDSPLARYAPVFVDYPGLQQQEYALDLPFN